MSEGMARRPQNIYKVVMLIQGEGKFVNLTVDRMVVAGSLISAMSAAVQATMKEHRQSDVTVTHVIDIASNVIIAE